MSVILIWLLDQTGSRVLDRLLVAIRGGPLSNELHEAIERWSDELPESAWLASTDALFPNRRVNDPLVQAPCLERVRKSFKQMRVPEKYEMEDALLEQWLYVRKTKRNRQPFFDLEREDAVVHLSALSDALVSICSNSDALFRATAISLLREIRDGTLNEGEAAELPDETVGLLSAEQKTLILRMRQYDGRCGIWATKGEEKSLWVPGPICNMQWGWERTSDEVIISGKDKGNRDKRLAWIDVVYTLDKMSILTTIPEDACVYELTDFGWHVAKRLHDSDADESNALA